MKKERKMKIFFSYYMYKYWTIGPHCSTKQQLALSKYLTIYHLSPFGKRCDSLLFLSRDNLYQVWEKLAQWFWEDLNSTMYFTIRLSFLCEKGIPALWRRVWLLWTNMNPLSLQIFCAKFCWYWLSGSEKCEKITNRWTERG